MAEEKDIALLADNDIIVEIEVQEAPTVIVESPSTTTAEISGDSALGIIVSTLPTLAKEATLLAKVAELKEALNSIDFTAIEQAIKSVEDSTAKETTLTQGVGDIIKAVENIDFTDLENSIAEVKNAVANIDFSTLAKEDTLTQVASKVEEVGNKIDNIKLPEIDTTELAKQGDNQEATNSAIYNSIGYAIEKLEDMAGDGGGGSVESIAAELVAGKKLIAAAITEKGVETSPTDSMMQMAENVGSIITTEGYVFPTQSMQDSITEINTEIKNVDLSWLVNEDGYAVMRNLKRIVINYCSSPFFTVNIGYFFPNLETIVIRSSNQRTGLFVQHGNLIFPKLTQIHVNRGFGITRYGGTLEGIVDLSALTEISSSLSIYRTGTASSTMMITKVILGSVVKGETIYILDNISYPSPTHDTSRLTDVEVMEGFAVNLNLGRCNHITRENIVEHIFKRLATVAATRTVSIDATPFALLTDEDIAIATNKGWTIQSV